MQFFYVFLSNVEIVAVEATSGIHFTGPKFVELYLFYYFYSFLNWISKFGWKFYNFFIFFRTYQKSQ